MNFNNKYKNTTELKTNLTHEKPLNHKGYSIINNELQRERRISLFSTNKGTHQNNAK